MVGLVGRAMEFATKAHEGQVRRYTGEPYINHPMNVLKLVHNVGATEETQAAALLHDVVEDCGVTFEELDKAFGERVSSLVWALTDCQHRQRSGYEAGMNRKARKEIDRVHLSLASHEAQTIKLADIIDNTASIVKYDPSFAKVYLAEMRELLKVLTKGDKGLWNIANGITL